MHNKISKDGQRKLSIVVCVTIFLMITITSVHAISKDGNVDLYPPDSKPYGLTFGEWASKWHTWLYSIPAPINPATDTTGKNCAQNQAGPVWFLAGTTGGAVDRTCSVPAGKGLVFPIIAAECSFAENPNLKNEEELKTCTINQDNTVTHMELTIDGVNISDLQKFRAHSTLFSFVFSKDNIGGVPPGATQGVADGYWIVTKPLLRGEHTIHFRAVSVDYTTTAASQSFVIDTTYHINVV